MKKYLLLLIAVLLCAAPIAARADAKSDAAVAKMSPGAEKVAQTVSMITGVAISPLMGVGAVGCWQYCKAKTEAEKAKLPWYANPLFWAPSLLLVLVCFVKDTAGAALPTAFKKPLDVAETVENKISGLVATGAFVPIAASVFHATGGDSAMLSALGFAGVDMSWLYNTLMIPVAMIAFVVVFIASNAINILILLSPFTVVDAGLKAFRTAILATVGLIDRILNQVARVLRRNARAPRRNIPGQIRLRRAGGSQPRRMLFVSGHAIAWSVNDGGASLPRFFEKIVHARQHFFKSTDGVYRVVIVPNVAQDDCGLRGFPAHWLCKLVS